MPQWTHRQKVLIVFEEVYVHGLCDRGGENATKFHRGGEIACRVLPGSEISGTSFKRGKFHWGTETGVFPYSFHIVWITLLCYMLKFIDVFPCNKSYFILKVCFLIINDGPLTLFY